MWWTHQDFWVCNPRQISVESVGSAIGQPVSDHWSAKLLQLRPCQRKPPSPNTLTCKGLAQLPQLLSRYPKYNSGPQCSGIYLNCSCRICKSPTICGQWFIVNPAVLRPAACLYWFPDTHQSVSFSTNLIKLWSNTPPLLDPKTTHFKLAKDKKKHIENFFHFLYYSERMVARTENQLYSQTRS